MYSLFQDLTIVQSTTLLRLLAYIFVMLVHIHQHSRDDAFRVEVRITFDFDAFKDMTDEIYAHCIGYATLVIRDQCEGWL